MVLSPFQSIRREEFAQPNALTPLICTFGVLEVSLLAITEAEKDFVRQFKFINDAEVTPLHKKAGICTVQRPDTADLRYLRPFVVLEVCFAGYFRGEKDFVRQFRLYKFC